MLPAPSAVGGLLTIGRGWSARMTRIAKVLELRVPPLRRRIETELSPPRWPWSAHTWHSLRAGDS
eukprot:8108557-Heterocapsa_arctica.AAC.1